MPDTQPAVLLADSIRKSFSTPAGTIDVLTDVNLAVARGESVSVRGESGAGKTTLLQILGGSTRRIPAKFSGTANASRAAGTLFSPPRARSSSATFFSFSTSFPS